MVSKQHLRRIVWTGSIVAITVSGAWLGAGLKTDREHKTAGQKVREATLEEQIAQLEESRTALVRSKMAIERKIDQLEKKRAGVTRKEGIFGRERR